MHIRQRKPYSPRRVTRSKNNEKGDDVRCHQEPKENNHHKRFDQKHTIMPAGGLQWINGNTQREEPVEGCPEKVCRNVLGIQAQREEQNHHQSGRRDTWKNLSMPAGRGKRKDWPRRIEEAGGPNQGNWNGKSVTSLGIHCHRQRELNGVVAFLRGGERRNGAFRFMPV